MYINSYEFPSVSNSFSYALLENASVVAESIKHQKEYGQNCLEECSASMKTHQ